MPTYRIDTLGCKLNQADSSTLETRLRGLGLRRATESADIVILNTCTVTAGADREARQIARRLRRDNPNSTLIATGCYAERDSRSLAAAAGIDHVVGMRDQVDRIAGIVADALGVDASAPTVACDPGAAAADRTRVYLKIQDGCNLRCSYCIIPAVRGGSRSVQPGIVIERLKDLVEAGYREIVFTGVNTGDYGKDLDPPLRLHQLLERAVRVRGLGRLRLNSLEPKTVTPELLGLLADSGGRIARHLQIPLQSGSDSVLGRMRRNYRAGEYGRVLDRLRRAVPAIGLGADVIVGFPGETESEFEETRRFVASSPLNYLHVFSYSPRPGTPAAEASDQVPAPVIKERSACLRALGRDLSLRFRRSFAGRNLEVLTLRAIRPDGRLRALSDNFIDVGLDLDGVPAGPLMNRLLPATVVDATEDGTTARLV